MYREFIGFKNIAYNIEICLNATELVEKSKNVNFLFLDMEINGISGIDMGLKLRTLKINVTLLLLRIIKNIYWMDIP